MPVSAPMERIRTLVIDDDDIARELLCDVLRRAGHEIFELPSPIGASRLISRMKIQVVVLDVLMPSINGDKLARLLRDANRGKELAIVLVSSRSVEELHALAVEARADEVVCKDDIRTELPRAIARACNQRLTRTTTSPKPLRSF